MLTLRCATLSEPALPLRLRLPLIAIACAAAATADPARAPPPACVVSAGARSFDLAESAAAQTSRASTTISRHVASFLDGLL
jgi:hypothetical protein